MSFNTPQLWCCLLVSCAYLALFVMASVQLSRHFINRHSMRSFQFSFLALVALWALMRILYLLVIDLHTWPVWVQTLIFMLPAQCQVAMFSLLIVFCAKIVMFQQRRLGLSSGSSAVPWQRRKRVYFAIYSAGNGVFFLSTIAFAVTYEISSTKRVGNILSKVYYSLAAFFFIGISCLAAFYTRRLGQLRWQQQRAAPLNDRKNHRRRKRYVVMMALINLIVSTRAIYDTLSVFNATPSVHVPQSETHAPLKLVSPLGMLLMLFWEVVPTLVVAVYFRKIPTSPTRLTLKDILLCRCRRAASEFDPLITKFETNHVPSTNPSSDDDSLPRSLCGSPDSSFRHFRLASADFNQYNAFDSPPSSSGGSLTAAVTPTHSTRRLANVENNSRQFQPRGRTFQEPQLDRTGIEDQQDYP